MMFRWLRLANGSEGYVLRRIQITMIVGSIALASYIIPLSASKAEPPTAKIVGLGAATCREFNRDVRRSFHIQRDYFAWAQGFMSGILMRAPPGKDEGLDLTPPELPLQKQVEFLQNFCTTNPDKDYTDGVVELYRVLRGGHKSGAV